METFNISEAFQQLKMINEETFDLSSKEDLDAADEFLTKDEDDESIQIIDLEAETEEDLKDSYIGNVILDCNICHSKIYKAKEDVVLCNDGDCTNIDEECPYCYSNEGFKIIGEIAPFMKEEEKKEPEDTEFEVEVDGEDIEVEEPDEVNESLTEDRHELARRIRRNDFNYDSGVDAKYAEDGDTYIQLQDRETHEHRMGVNGRPKVSSHTWGRVWKDGNYEKSFEGPKYEVRKDMAKYLDDDAVNEAADSDKKLFVEYKIYVDDRLYEISHTKERADEITKILTNIYPDAEIVAKPYRHYESGIARKRLEQIIAKQKTEYGITESFEKVNIETESDMLEMSSDENGKVTVTTEPKKEMIAPVSTETAEEIIDDNIPEEDIPEEDIPEEDEETIEYSVDEFSEEEFDDLGESYFKRIYENVNSFKTINVLQKNNSIVVEGIIDFKTKDKKNSKKRTSFVFEAYDARKDGKVRFVGMNENLSKGKKSYVLTGRISDNKFISESLNYNYNVNGARVCGTIVNESWNPPYEIAKELQKPESIEKMNQAGTPQEMKKILIDIINAGADISDSEKKKAVGYISNLKGYGPLTIASTYMTAMKKY